MARRGHGEGSIYQRKDGRWVASIVLENHQRKDIYGKTRKEVQEKLRVALNDKKQGTLGTGASVKLGAYLIDWLDNVHKSTIRMTTYTQYHSIIKAHIIPALGHVTVQKLTVQMIQTFYTKKIESGATHSRVMGIHAVLHKALDDAVRWNIISRNVSDLVSLPAATTHEIQPLTVDQVHTLMEVVKGHHFEALILVAVTTGMRRGELLALRWSDIDFENGFIYIRRSVGRVPKMGFVENDPKTRMSKRKITLPDVVIKALKEHQLRQEQAKQLVSKRWQEHNIVFPNKFGGFHYTNRMLITFHALVAKAGLPRIRFHDLRHSAATILLIKGVHPKVVQELLGHSKISITMDIYSHVLPSMQKDAMDTMDQIFKSDEE
jgi:integrase